MPRKLIVLSVLMCINFIRSEKESNFVILKASHSEDVESEFERYPYAIRKKMFKATNGNKLFWLDDKLISSLDKNEIQKMECVGDFCSEIQLVKEQGTNDLIKFGINKKPEFLSANYSMICRNLELGDKRDCYLEVKVFKIDQPDDELKDIKPKSTAFFLTIFLGAEIAIVLVVAILSGLRGRGPLKKILRLNRG